MVRRLVGEEDRKSGWEYDNNYILMFNKCQLMFFHCSHREYLKDGLKHMQLKFYIEGSEPGLKGTVHSESMEVCIPVLISSITNTCEYHTKIHCFQTFSSKVILLLLRFLLNTFGKYFSEDQIWLHFYIISINCNHQNNIKNMK